MKKVFILTTLFLWASVASMARIADGKIKITDLRVADLGETVQVDFTATVAPKAVKRNHSLVFAPVIVHEGYRQSLPPVVVQGEGSKVARQRREWVAQRTQSYENAVVTANAQTVSVTATVPFQRWMLGADLVFESVEGGCCTYGKLPDVLFAQNIITRQTPDPVAVAEDPTPSAASDVSSAAAEWVPASVADSLSTAFTFVLPISELDENEPFKIYDDERETALIIYFRAGNLDIHPQYMGNAHTLANLTAVVNMVMESTDSRVERIVVAGFSSPEGKFDVNDRLAFDRAVSVKRYLMETTGATDKQIMVFNGSVDWRGLRAMIERSDMPEKQQVLSIIDNTPVWDARRQVGRLGELMRFNGGRTYRYMLSEYFPYLRNGAFIRVYYENQ